jgi:hypothetical protein
MDGPDECWINVENGGGRGEDACDSCCPVGMGIFGMGLSSDQVDECTSVVGKVELHRVLNCFQNSPDFGVHVCEAFRDPRKSGMDAYWDDVKHEAFSIDELHHIVGGVDSPFSLELCASMHRFARVLERLSKRIDRIVLDRSTRCV